MFLKRIELAGFKSFADKTEMEFVRGITAVVVLERKRQKQYF